MREGIWYYDFNPACLNFQTVSNVTFHYFSFEDSGEPWNGHVTYKTNNRATSEMEEAKCKAIVTLHRPRRESSSRSELPNKRKEVPI